MMVVILVRFGSGKNTSMISGKNNDHIFFPGSVVQLGGVSGLGSLGWFLQSIGGISERDGMAG